MRACDTFEKHPFTSTRLRLPCYTKNDYGNNLIYTVDYGVIHLRMLMVPNSKVESLSIFKVLQDTQGNGHFTTVSQGRIQHLAQ